MTIEQMKERKIELGLTCEMIAEASGVPLGTVQKIFGGITKAPRKQTIEAIERILRPGEAGIPTLMAAEQPDSGPGQATYASCQSRPELAFREPPVQYAAARKEPLHTLDDYYALPDDQRVELIDGVIYDMTAPTVTHQTLALETALRFRECIKKHDMPCRAVIAPLDVRLDEDNKTVVQPDVVVYCGKDRAEDQKLWIPELTVEVMSPSTRKKDLTIKLEKYSQAGVREYWIVDPENEKVLVYDFASETYPKIYDFTDKVPVGLSGGICEIDFSEIKDELEESAELLPHLFG